MAIFQAFIFRPANGDFRQSFSCTDHHVAQTTTLAWFHFWAKRIILQHLSIKLSRRDSIIFRLNFKAFFRRYVLSLYLSLQILLMFFPRNYQYVICNSEEPRLVSELSYHAWGIPNKYAPLFQACCSVFSRNLLKDLLDWAGEMSVVLIFDICNVYEIVAYDWLHSRCWGRV